jgi:uncharacterized protein YjbI with pentapeptide repeats
MADNGYSSAQCKYYDVCGRDIEGDAADGLCILHSTDATKDADAFAEALAKHRERNGDKFIAFVFPEGVGCRTITFSEGADFSGATFTKDADFSGARFSEGANFSSARFSEGANFSGATFTKDADFTDATFSEGAYFLVAKFSEGANFSSARFTKDARFTGAKFSEGANFREATFSEGADFSRATFTKDADFTGATFTKDADFTDATFSEGANFLVARFSEGADFSGARFSEGANFLGATFSGRTLFAGRSGNVQAKHIFAGTAVDFRQVVINPPDVITFLGADLTTCRFLDTDLRKVQLVDVEWPKKRGRVRVHDEIAPDATGDGRRRPWPQIERLYRELKQNYEDRRDYERAGDFHYGEKEMRRKNPGTAGGLRFFLTLYWLFSGYGERYLPPLLWAGLLFVGSTIGYMWWGLRLKAGEAKLAWTNGWDWLQGAY